MKSKTFYIKLQPHFRLWVDLKDKIAFEAALYERNIPFHIDDNQSTVGSGIRYFFSDRYSGLVDDVVKSTAIIACAETIPSANYEISRKVNRLYIIIAVVMVLLLIIVTLIVEVRE
ncbi:hypothetical protein OGH69_05630 [Flavobacterium sp. MFBS3-15]|uniref:hypothetical protein n=1 Tax=Flavobacterium sp. MFBS3-15 TaxID=2989816 RepID=UPI00223631E4|nr:hypothetical protein [Flavobacterium sp. MFBS3-15]MCW4468437.1 hypothetical protein [Flavobacterium sp. MFBS3-15]